MRMFTTLNEFVVLVMASPCPGTVHKVLEGHCSDELYEQICKLAGPEAAYPYHNAVNDVCTWARVEAALRDNPNWPQAT